MFKTGSTSNLEVTCDHRWL